jgi:hypothetical protein
MRDAVTVGMLYSRLNSAVVRRAMCGGKREIARVKVRPFLPVVLVACVVS